MSAPLSGQFSDNLPQTTGQYAAPNVDIAPRGTTRLAQDSPVYVGSAGIYWDKMPTFIAGQNRFAGFSTLTGATLGTPAEAELGKVGGGASKAEIPAYGGTAAY
jgi:hypothetical protein